MQLLERPLAMKAWPFCLCEGTSKSIASSLQGGQGIFILQGCSRDEQLSQQWL